jgi:hypothetical protein
VATTIDEIVDRIRSVLVASPFEYVESQSPFDFTQQPVGSIDGAFRVIDRGTPRVKGGFRYSEDRTDSVQIWVAKKFAGEPVNARRTLSRAMSSISVAVTRDGHDTSGEYVVPDDGRSYEIRAEQGAEYAVLQFTLPVNYEFQS